MSQENLEKLARFSLSLSEFMQRVKQEPEPDISVKNDNDEDNDETEVFTAKTDEELAEEDRMAHEVFHKVQMENITMALAQKCNGFVEFHERMKKLRSEP
jgi:hypothetical protein